MTDLSNRLTAFLARFHGKEVEWGVDDCSALCAQWVRECGYDVEIPAYSSLEEAHRLIRDAGGLVTLWDEIAASAGVFERAGTPQPGDVSIIPTDRFGPVGVIWVDMGLCWWRAENRGYWIAPVRVEKTWAII